MSAITPNPAAAAASWTTLSGDGPAFLTISIVLAVVGCGCFIARTCSQWLWTKGFHIDYWFSLLTFVLSLIAQIFFSSAITYGLAAHARDLQPFQIVVALRGAWISQILGIIAAVTGKLAIIAFLDRIQARVRGFPWFLAFVGVSNIIITVIVVILILLQCRPTEKLWDDAVEGSCSLASFNYAYFQGSWSAASDAALALYPIPLILRLKLSARLKLGLSFLLSFGFVAAACSAVKTAQLSILTRPNVRADSTFYIARSALFTIVEAWVVMIVVCVPPLWPLAKVVYARLRGRTWRPGTSATPGAPSGYGGLPGESHRSGSKSVSHATKSSGRVEPWSGVMSPSLARLAGSDRRSLARDPVLELEEGRSSVESGETYRLQSRSEGASGEIMVTTNVHVEYEEDETEGKQDTVVSTLEAKRWGGSHYEP